MIFGTLIQNCYKKDMYLVKNIEIENFTKKTDLILIFPWIKSENERHNRINSKSQTTIKNIT